MARKGKKRDDDRDDDAPEAPKVKSDAYVGLLAISFLALVVGCVFMFLDHDELAKQNLPAPSIAASDSGLSVPGAPAAPKN